MKKTISMLLSIIMVLSIFSCLTISVSAATVYETEDNDSVAKADSIRFADVVKGNLSDSGDVDYYSFTVSQKGYVNINMSNAYNSSGSWYVYVYRYDNSLEEVYYKTVKRNETSHDFAKIGVEPGTYVICIDYNSNVSSVQYELTVNHVATQTWECEDNDDVNTADAISLGYTYGGSLRDSGDVDYYTLYVSQKGYLNINMTNEYNNGGSWYVYVYKYTSSLTEVYYETVKRSEISHDFAKIGVEPGTYIIRIDYNNSVTDVEYNFTVNHVATHTWESEDNDNVNKADVVSLGYTYGGSLRDSGDVDYYTFTVNTPGYLGVSLNTEYASSGSWYVYLNKFTTYLEDVGYDILKRSDCGGSLDTVYVEPGTYIVCVDYNNNVTDVEYYITCNLYDSTPTLLYKDGIWYCVVYGQIDWGYTGLVEYNGGWFYVANGVVDWNYTGLAEFCGNYYHIANGVLDWGYTGLSYYNGNWWYVTNGVINWNYTGLTCYYGTWYYVTNGFLDWNVTTLTYFYDTWYYVENGVLNWNYTGLAEFCGNYYHIANGVLDWGYTGLSYYNGNWWYVTNGVINWNYTGLTCYYGTWYYVTNGFLDWNVTTLTYFCDVWYYVKGGTIAWDYTGWVKYNSGWYYITNGWLDWSKQ